VMNRGRRIGRLIARRVFGFSNASNYAIALAFGLGAAPNYLRPDQPRAQGDLALPRHGLTKGWRLHQPIQEFVRIFC